jgi:hypothetical protein
MILAVVLFACDYGMKPRSPAAVTIEKSQSDRTVEPVEFLESARRPRREPDLVKATELPFWALIAWAIVGAVVLFCVGVSLGVVILQWAGAW